MKRIKSCFLSLLMLLIIFSTTAFSADEALHSVWVVKDCKVIVRPGSVIEKGVIIIRDGLIEYAGVNSVIPADAEIIDGAGLTAYAGFIDALCDSLLKMPEEKKDTSKYSGDDSSEKERGTSLEIKAFKYINLTKAGMVKFHKNGFTTALVLPTKGIFTGQASLFNLSQTIKEKALLRKDNLLGIGFWVSDESGYPDSLMGVIAYLKQKFADLAYYIMHISRWENEMRGIIRPEYKAEFEELLPFFMGKKQVVFLCRNQYDIIRAIKIGIEYKLNYLICDIGGEAFCVIPELKKSGAPVLLTLGFKSPSSSIYSQQGKDVRSEAERELYPSNAARLAEAGVKFAFSSYSTPEPEKFLGNIMIAIEKGLPAEKALNALTVDAAAVFGMDRALGTIEPGKIANLVISQGDPLVKDSKVKYVFADGIKFDMKEKKAEEGEKPTINASGKWEIITEGVMGMKFMLDMVQEEATLSGKRITQYGQDDFTDGTVSGNQISFTISISAMGRMVDIYVSGVVEGDTISGTINYGAMGAAEFTGRRIP